MSQPQATQSDVKTIHEFLADNPNVDVSKQWERCWDIHGKINDRILKYFGGAQLHPVSEGAEYYTSPDEQMEGSFFGYTGGGIDWYVRSWIGNRKASIIDMNINVTLSQHIRVPNLMIIFGTVPNLLFYADYVPRVDLKVNEDYVKKYYEGEANNDYLEFRANTDYVWSASHGPAIRAMQSPVCSSYITELTDEHIDQCEAYLAKFVDRWFRWIDEADEVPADERAAQQEYDFTYREYTNRSDPMNVLVDRVFGEEQAKFMLDRRGGIMQMDADRGKWS
ncbi:MAG: hypothetical protein HKN56_04565 [Gammaproteobacteria bacterium]|nr:hypothetical protein [Gammaproteobacteria bacterium]